MLKKYLNKGLFADLNNAEYHAAEGISKTGLDHFAKSPAHYKAYLETEKKETPAFRIGSLAHSLILEPETIKLAAAPECDRRTKEGKAIWAEFQAKNADSEIVTQEEFKMLTAMAESVKSHRAAGTLLSGNGKAEHSLFWQDEETGLICKCRPDFYRDSGIVVDLKTTKDASPYAFAKSCAAFRYHVQAAFYSAGLEAAGYPVKGFVFVAVEKEPPYAVGVYQIDEQALETARLLIKDELLALTVCINDDFFPAYSQEIEKINFPQWALNQNIQELNDATDYF